MENKNLKFGDIVNVTKWENGPSGEIVFVGFQIVSQPVFIELDKKADLINIWYGVDGLEISDPIGNCFDKEYKQEPSEKPEDFKEWKKGEITASPAKAAITSEIVELFERIGKVIK